MFSYDIDIDGPLGTDYLKILMYSIIINKNNIEEQILNEKLEIKIKNKWCINFGKIGKE